MDFNQDQQAVIENPNGARSVVAGPGSGKSTTMVGMIQSLLAAGVSSSDVRAVTFSKEMAGVLERKLKIKGVASTFHSLGYLICSEVERKPVEPELRYRLMGKLCKKWRLDYKELDHFIAKMRRAHISTEDAVNRTEFSDDLPYSFVMAYADYECTRNHEGWMDFDSMLADAVQALEKPDVRARWQPKYLIVDEAQDTDDCQWRMMQLMAEKHGNITVVGDPNQAIYGFRGAKPDNITNFQQWFPTGRKYYLGKNYRSTQTIVKFVRENAPGDTPQELLDRMVASRAEVGVPIDFKMYWSEEQEAESALALANKDPLQSIILARTNRMVGLLERICNKHNVRYHLMGKTGFWKQNEIRKAIDLLKNYPTLETAAAMSLALPGLVAKYAVDDRTERDNDAIENLGVLRAIGKDFRLASDFTTYANKMMHRRNDPKGVSISTCHQAKGGEWRNVYIIGASAKGFPHPKGDPREERRIWFVAISRATDVLRISFAGTPSPYLRRYLSEALLDRLREKAQEVEHLQAQHALFP